MTVTDLKGGMTFTRTMRLESPSLQETLTFMREGRTYVSVMTHSMASVAGELRGWLEVPECHEARLTGSPRTGDDGQPVMPYAFANVLISPSESSFALLLQVATDASRAFPGTISEANVKDSSGGALISPSLSLSNSKFFYEVIAKPSCRFAFARKCILCAFWFVTGALDIFLTGLCIPFRQILFSAPAH